MCRCLLARRRFTRRGRRATPAPSWKQKSSLSRRQGRLAAAARRVRTLRLPEALLARRSDCLWCLSCCSWADGWASTCNVSARVALIADRELSGSNSTSAGQSTSLADETPPPVPLLGRSKEPYSSLCGLRPHYRAVLRRSRRRDGTSVLR